MATGGEVAHVHVEAIETCSGEGRRHLDLAVDALFAQDRDAGPHPPSDIGCGDILRRVERRFAHQTRRARGRHRVPGLERALRIVAQRRHAVAGLGPSAMQITPARTPHAAAIAKERQFIVRRRLADHMAVSREPGRT